MVRGILVPHTSISALEGRVLTTGPPGKSLHLKEDDQPCQEDKSLWLHMSSGSHPLSFGFLICACVLSHFSHVRLFVTP